MGNLYIRIEPRKKVTVIQAWKLWVAQDFTTEVIREHHDKPSSAHGGRANTLEIEKMFLLVKDDKPSS